MGHPSKYAVKVAAAAILGLVSGVVTSGTLSSPAWAPFTGIVFALFLSLYSCWFEGVRSAQRIISFVLVTTSAFWIACLAAFVSVAGRSNESPYFGESVFFVGGIVGTAVVALARYHFIADNQHNSAVLWKVTLLSLIGGVIGAPAAWFDRLSYGRYQRASLPALFIVWQGCIAPLLVILFPRQSMLPQTSSPPSNVPQRESPLQFWKKALTVAAALFIAYWLVREARLERQLAESEMRRVQRAPESK
jgi:hypothetical protein